MSKPVKNATFMAGSPRLSGDVGTGEVNLTRGGGRGATVNSGAIAMTAYHQAGTFSSGGSILLFSGAGRLNSFTALWPAGVALAGNGELAVVSGQPIVAYDSAITARSGVYTDATITESGRAILYVWQPPRSMSSGVYPWTNNNFLPQQIDTPFHSGLCVMALSGAPGFRVTWTPETTTALSGANYAN